MRRSQFFFERMLALAIIIVFVISPESSTASDKAAIKRGKYVFNAAGCQGCHTDVTNNGPVLAGGRALKTPFGTYFGPNITPHNTHGIGNWTDAQFIRALREGISPAGKHYFPVFPYTSFTKLTRQDMKDLKAYIFTFDPVARPNTPHQIKFPFGWRLSMLGWKLFFFKEGEFQASSDRNVEVNRGAYLVEALGHCGECHTPRNIFGAAKESLAYSGTVDGPEGDFVPNMTPDQKTGLGKWTDEELVNFFKTGVYPWNDDVGGSMEEVITNGTSHMTDADLLAMVAYLRTLRPIEIKLKKRKK